MDKLTSDTLREHAAAPPTIAWESQARMMLRWAADLIDAAQAIREERAALTEYVVEYLASSGITTIQQEDSLRAAIRARGG